MLLHHHPGSHGWKRVGPYLIGKTVIYAVLGAIAGFGGMAFLAALSDGQQLLSVLAGISLLWIGVSTIRTPRAGAYGGFILQNWMGYFLRRHPQNGFFLGMANGLLPCPLVLALLVMAGSTATPAQGAAVMALLGVLTAPALLFAGWASQQLKRKWQGRYQLIGGLLLVLFGLITIGRPFIPHHHPGAHSEVRQEEHQSHHQEPASHHADHAEGHR